LGLVRFDWNPDKNRWLKEERGVSFEELALLISNGGVWRIMDHPNRERYPNQRVFFVPVDGYIFLVPYVIDGETIFLKTAIPSRKATRDYRQEKEIEG
jgi:uncharacterized DUF497 family protein